MEVHYLPDPGCQRDDSNCCWTSGAVLKNSLPEKQSDGDSGPVRADLEYHYHGGGVWSPQGGLNVMGVLTA